MLRQRRVTVVVVLFLSLAVGSARGGPPKLMSSGELPDDSRLQPLKDLDGFFPFEPAPSAEAWKERAAQQRLAMQVALGLWPMPTKTAANAVIHGRIDKGDYTIDKVYFESFPRYYVTGNLYRPKSADAETVKRPGILCPHGHFANGRFGDSGIDDVRRKIANGGERFENGGRNSIQARCVQLARMGCVVFQYDMVGYCDSVQVGYQLAHRFAKQRPEMIGANGWGFFSPQAESRLQSIMGLQAYNSIRALDWLSELPDVDPDRIAVTGASGGGTQTFILCALDPRPAVSVPAVMVSTAMQGGCTCENASLLRIGTGNVEFAALFAPKPMCLLSADDWTREMPSKGYPELKHHYEMLGAEGNLLHRPLLHFGHNYNHVSRTVMYQWLNRHLKLGLPEPVLERDYDRLTGKELSVWDDEHPKPAGGPQVERRLLSWWAEDATAQLAAVQPRDDDTLRAYRDLVGGAIGAIIGRSLPAMSELEFDEFNEEKANGYVEIAGLLRNLKHDESLPLVLLVPDGWHQGRVAIWLDPAGKSGLYDGDSPKTDVNLLLKEGVAVVGVDLLFQGEFLSDGPITETRRVDNQREAAAYTLGYNHSLLVRRVHDVLNVIGYVSQHQQSPSEVWLLGLDGMGPVAAATRAVAGAEVHRALIDTQGFRFENIGRIRDPNLMPGGAKYHDLPGILSLSVPHELWIAGEDEVGVSIVRQAYAAAGAEDQLHLLPLDLENVSRTAVHSLIKSGQ